MKMLPRLICWLILIMWMSASGLARAGSLDGGADIPVCFHGDGPVMHPAETAEVELPAPAPPAPVVTVKVLVPACADADKNLEYRILVENCSPAAAHRVTVLDLIPANAKFVRASPQPHRTSPELQWQLGTLKANSCQEITLVLRPTNAEDVTNCVRVQFEHGVCVTTRQAGSSPKKMLPADGVIPKEPTKPSTEEPPLATGSKLELNVKGPEKHLVGQPAHYVITVANVGTGPASAVLIESELPEKLTFVRASEGGKSAGGLPGVIAWHLGDLPAGKSHTVELTVQAKEKGVFCIKTLAMFGPAPGTFTARKETCTTFVVGAPGMVLELHDREDPIAVRGTTSYPIQITNQGSAPLTNIRLEAFIPADMELVEVRGQIRYREEGKTLIFEPIASLEPGTKVQCEVHTRALLPGDMRFKIRLSADQLKEGGPVHEEESTTVYSEDLPFQP